MTKTELARASKCDLSTISRILSGKRNASRAVALRLVDTVKGTRLLDWLFATQNFNKLNAAVRRAADERALMREVDPKARPMSARDAAKKIGRGER